MIRNIADERAPLADGFFVSTLIFIEMKEDTTTLI